MCSGVKLLLKVLFELLGCLFFSGKRVTKLSQSNESSNNTDLVTICTSERQGKLKT